MLDEPLLRQLFDDAVARSGAVGAQLSIIKRGEQVDLAAGLAHARDGVEMTVDTAMQIGSVTKVFNATVVTALAERGLVQLDVPVQQQLPGFEVADADATKTLTPRHLMSMCSGLDNGPYVYFGGGEDALGTYVQQMRTLRQHFRPGEHFGYANAGTCIAGHTASHAAGKPWETLLRELVLEPAGLNHAALVDEDLSVQPVAAGHTVRADGRDPEVVEPILSAHRSRAPSGATFALSTRDLARFGAIFLNGGVADTGERILRPESVELMMTPQIDVPTRKYGDAWCVGPYTADWTGVRAWGHGGTSLTATSFLHWLPEQQGVIAFVVNEHAAMAAFSEAMFGDVTRAAFGCAKPKIGPPRDEPIDAHRYLGVYQQIGMQLEVLKVEGNALAARWVPDSAQSLLGAEQSVFLRPLARDHFLVDPVGGPDKHRGIVDTAFFGDDGEGRATNVLNLVFAMSRVET